MTQTPLPLPAELDLVELISKEAHDLKSPFNRILGFTKMLMKGMSGPVTDMQKDDLTVVYQNSAQAMAMMSNLVDMARLQRGEKAFTPKESNLNNLIAQVQAYWKQNKAQEGFTLEVHPPEQDILLQADESLLRQAILNWVLYVMEYVEAPARLDVEARETATGLEVEIRSQGKKKPGASEVEMTMAAYIGQKIIRLHGGETTSATGGEEGAQVQLRLPKA